MRDAIIGLCQIVQYVRDDALNVVLRAPVVIFYHFVGGAENFRHVPPVIVFFEMSIETVLTLVTS